MVWWRLLLCRLLFHKLVVVKGYDRGVSQKVRCIRCGKAFGIHYGVKAFVPWDGELEEMHRILGPAPR